MRKIRFTTLVALIGLAGFAGTASARTHHSAMPRHAAEFLDVVPTAPVRAPSTSPNLDADPHPCLWGTVACTY